MWTITKLLSSLAKADLTCPFTGKKLKRRLEDLERRAGSSDEAEPEVKPQPATKTTKKRTASKPQAKTSPAPQPQLVAPLKSAPHMQFTPPMENSDEMIFPSPAYSDRERSYTPPLFSYSTYPPPEDQGILAPYGSSQPYPVMSSSEAYPSYLSSTTMASSLPPLTHFSDAIKRESYSLDAPLAPYVGYGYGAGLDVSAPSSYEQSNPHVSDARLGLTSFRESR